MLYGLCEYLIGEIFGVAKGSPYFEMIHFFIYDSIKILLLLFFMIAFVGVLRTYISQDRIRKVLSGGRFGLSYFMASAFGALTPFCSCSSIPIFISFMKAGVPLGPAFSFLVTSPMLNEYIAVLMIGFFGWKITIAYIVFGMLIGVFSGFIIGKLGLENEIVEDFISNETTGGDIVVKKFKDRIDYGISEAKDITLKIWYWVLLGVGIGAFIHGFIPQELIESTITKTGIFSVPIATLLGIPVYANCSAVIPIAVVLFQKGMPLGTALAFMLAVASLSLPEAVILRRAMKIRLILIFFGIVGMGIILVGYVFNVLEILLR